MATTIKSVQKAINKAGLPLEIVRGEGYHYFIFDDGKAFETVSVYAPYTSDLSVDSWVYEATEAWAKIKARI